MTSVLALPGARRHHGADRPEPSPGRGRRRRLLAGRVATATLAAAGCLAAPPALAAPAHPASAPGAARTFAGWDGSWSTGPVQPGTSGLSAKGFNDQTLREVVRPTLGGEQLRIRLSNVFGRAPLTIDDAAVGVRDTGASVVPGTQRPVRFHNRRRVTVPAGEEIWSDPVPLRVTAGRDLAVSLFAHGATGPVTWHPTALTTSYYSASGDGDLTRRTGGAGFGSTTTSWYVLDGVDVRTPRRSGAVVAFGDSITDGSNSTLDAGHTWPLDLARRLHADPRGRGLSVLNEGIAGNRVLNDAGTAGVSAQERFGRDALAQTGVRDVLFLEGINDIGHDQGADGGPLTAAELIDGITAVVDAAHRHGLRIIGGTLTPIGHTPTGGRTPRNFAIDPSGRFLFAANQNSDTVVTFRLDEATGQLTPTGQVTNIPSPVCLKFAPTGGV